MNIYLVHGETQRVAIKANPAEADSGKFEGKEWKIVPWDPNPAKPEPRRLAF